MPSQHQPIRAIGYDVDGTLVNSEPLHVAAWHEALRRCGHNFEELPGDFQNTLAGRKPIEIATFMVQQLAIGVSPEEFLATKHALFMEQVTTSLEPMPGAVESVKRFAKGYVLGIGAALDRAYVDLVLARFGLTDDFKMIVTGDIITRGKPDPETYLVLAQKLAVEPSAMVVFEDAASGIASAKAAGCRCIAILNPYTPQQDTSRADRTVASLNEVTKQLLENL